MNAVSNFRDFGGAITRDGARVRAGRLFRSGQTGPLGDTPFETLAGRAFSVVADLRFPDEAGAAPMPWQEPAQPTILTLDASAPGETAPHHAFMRPGIASVADVRRRYLDFYTALPSDPRYRPLIGRVLAAVADTGGAALIHCSAGKDRTGILCGLILTFLDVPRDAIVADYMLSSAPAATRALRPELLRRFEARGLAPPDETVLAAMLSVDPDYLLASFVAVEREYGTLAAYAEVAGAGPDLARRLRDRLLH